MDWYEEDVQQLIEKRDHLPYTPQTVFYGSSSIRLWENLYEDFKSWQPVNLGFGGSTLEACVYYFDWLVKPVATAQKIVVYAGDNDLGDGRSADEVLIFFRQLKSLLAENFPGIPYYYVSIKPSISRWNINDTIKQTNSLIQGEMKPRKSTFLLSIFTIRCWEQTATRKQIFLKKTGFIYHQRVMKCGKTFYWHRFLLNNLPVPKQMNL